LKLERRAKNAFKTSPVLNGSRFEKLFKRWQDLIHKANLLGGES
jgi:hypothetical protein